MTAKYPKGILLDIDGTMVGSTKQVTPRLANILAKLNTETDIRVATCTGRSYAMLYGHILNFFNADIYHVVAGGAQVVNKQSDILWENVLPDALVKDIAAWIHQHDGAVSFGKGSTYYASTSLSRKHFAEQKWKYAVEDVSVLQDWSVPLLSLLQLPIDPTQQLPHLDEVTIKYMSNQHGFYADVTAHNVTKITGATQWAQHYGLHLDEVMAVGDSVNDVELLQAVGYPVAMGNAIPELKDIANRVIGNADDDGLAVALEELFASRLS